LDYYLSIDKREALWTLQKLTELEIKNSSFLGNDSELQKIQMKSLYNLLLESILNSPASAFLGLNVIYLKGFWSEVYLPYILNHEELHILVFRIMQEDTYSDFNARIFSKELIDSEACRIALAEVFNLNYSELREALKNWVVSNLPGIRLLYNLKRKLKRILRF